MRGFVVVSSVCAAIVGALSTLTACPPSRVAAEPDCLTFVDCYLPPTVAEPDSGYGVLAAHSEDADEEELRCYAGFLGTNDDGSRGDGSQIEQLLAPMRRAYGEDGSCWAEGYSAVADGVTDEGLAAGYHATCLEVCQTELLAECRRLRDGDRSACPDLRDRVQAFCDAHSAAEIDDARCPGAEGEGEGEGGEGEGEGE